MSRACVFLLVLALALAVGCARTNISEMFKALAKDEATFCHRLTLSTPWGTETSTIYRTGIQSGNVSCNADGLTVKSDQQMITLPVAPMMLTPSPGRFP